jgi:hypothetical protein
MDTRPLKPVFGQFIMIAGGLFVSGAAGIEAVNNRLL